jgi:hypothetical protein
VRCQQLQAYTGVELLGVESAARPHGSATSSLHSSRYLRHHRPEALLAAASIVTVGGRRVEGWGAQE